MTSPSRSGSVLKRALSTLVAVQTAAIGGCAKSSEPPQSESTGGPGASRSLTTVYDFSLDTIDGQAKSLSAYRGKVLLIVNVASKCGFTPQYAGLQELHERYAADGLVVMGVPSNDFMGQEPGSNEEIKTFCESKFDVTFDMFSKVSVKGKEIHPLYAWLTSEKGKVSWNFNKFLVGRDGRVMEQFGSMVKPESLELESAIKSALKAPATSP
jgi:glutathione peroxidase